MVEVLVAMVNGGVVEIASGLMLFVAVVGVLANLAGLLILRGRQAASLNVRGVY
jgi:cobalt-zinc-cadmium efflux system protein